MKGKIVWSADLIVTGLSVGVILTPTSTEVLAELQVIRGIMLIGGGIIIGMINGLFFMPYEMSAKEKVIAGATIGAGAAAGVILIMPLINVGGLPQQIIGGIIGVIVAAGVGWAFNGQGGPQPDQ